MGVAPRGKRDEPGLGREAEDLIVEQLELRVLEELLRIVALRQEIDGASKPLIGAAFHGEARIVVHAFLVERVGRDAVFGDLLHVDGADLQFDALAAGSDHGGVDRAVIVLLRGRDVVLVAAGDHRPARMNDAERPVAFVDRLDDDAEPEDVGKLLERDGFALHLAPDRIGPLLAPRHLGIDALGLQLRRQRLLDLLDQLLAFRR